MGFNLRSDKKAKKAKWAELASIQGLCFSPRLDVSQRSLSIMVGEQDSPFKCDFYSWKMYERTVGLPLYVANTVSSFGGSLFNPAQFGEDLSILIRTVQSPKKLPTSIRERL